MENEGKLEIFRTAPVLKAVMQNALPAMAAVLMILVYNLADTFFIGQTHDALMVAAVSLATPVFGAVYFAAFMGLNGLVWAQPVAYVLSIMIAVALFSKTIKRMQVL